MKRNLIILTILLLFANSAYAQEDEKPIAASDKNAVEDTKELVEDSKDNEDSNQSIDEYPTFTKKPNKIPNDFILHKQLDDVFANKKPKSTQYNENIAKDFHKEKKTSNKTKEEEKKPQYEVLLSANVQSLTNGFGTWKTASLFTSRKSNDGKILWGEYRLSQRQSREDQEIGGGIYKPLPNKFAFTVEGSYSKTNNFVPKIAIRGEVEKVFKGGWVAHIGVRYKYYDPVDVSTFYTQIEKYWGNHRLAYTLNINDVSNAGTAPSNTLSYNKYYGERLNTYGFTVSAGKEEEFVGPIVGVTRSNTFSMTGSLKQWITDDFGMFVDATIHRQGSFYYRRGLNFGIRHRF